MTQTATIAISVSPIAKILQDYLSDKVFTSLLPENYRQELTVLNYFESVKLSKNKQIYYRLLLASVLLYLHPLSSFKLPLPFLSPKEKEEEFQKLQNSPWHFIRANFQFLKEQAIHALFKDVSIKSIWKEELSSAAPISTKTLSDTYDYIVIGQNGKPAASILSTAGKKILLLELGDSSFSSHKNYFTTHPVSPFKKHILKRLTKDVYQNWDKTSSISQKIGWEEIEACTASIEQNSEAPNCDTLFNVHVEKILFENKKAVAVQTSIGTFYTSHGVILSAGAIENPSLLLRSDYSHPELGKNLRVNLSISCLGMLQEERSQLEGPYERIEISQFQKQGFLLSSEILSIETLLYRLPHTREAIHDIRKSISHLTSWSALIHAKTSGKVALARYGKPFIFFDPTYEDMETVRSAMNKLCQVIFQLSAKEVYPTLLGKVRVLKSARESAMVRTISPQAEYFPMELLHTFGTCRMGEDPKKNIVSLDFKVNGIENLYCADESVFPSSTNEDPTLTAQAFSHILASRLLEIS